MIVVPLAMADKIELGHSLIILTVLAMILILVSEHKDVVLLRRDVAEVHTIVDTLQVDVVDPKLLREKDNEQRSQ